MLRIFINKYHIAIIICITVSFISFTASAAQDVNIYCKIRGGSSAYDKTRWLTTLGTCDVPVAGLVWGEFYKAYAGSSAKVTLKIEMIKDDNKGIKALFLRRVNTTDRVNRNIGSDPVQNNWSDTETQQLIDSWKKITGSAVSLDVGKQRIRDAQKTIPKTDHLNAEGCVESIARSLDGIKLMNYIFNDPGVYNGLGTVAVTINNPDPGCAPLDFAP